LAILKIIFVSDSNSSSNFNLSVTLHIYSINILSSSIVYINFCCDITGVSKYAFFKKQIEENKQEDYCGEVAFIKL